MDILIGYRDVDNDYVIDKMNDHCKLIDKKLRKVDLLTNGHTDYHDQLIAKRGFTYDEYLWLFDGGLDENRYHHYPIFNFLKIITDVQRRYYTARYEASKEDYVKLLQRSNIPQIQVFFRKVAATIPVSDLKMHCYISGMTGSGKSVFAKNLFYRLQKDTSHSLVLIDPHGDLALDIKRFHLNEDHDRVVYIDPSLDDTMTPVINPLQLRDRSEKNIEVVTNQLMTVIEDTMPRGAKFTAQMATILSPCISVLLRKGNATFEDLQRFMNDETNGELVEIGKKSPLTTERKFFTNLFELGKYKVSKESIATRIQQLVNIQSFYQLTCGKSTIDLERCVNNGKIIIVNLSKAHMDERIVPVFGRFIMAMLLGYAFKRGRTNTYRKPTFVFIDECQNFISRNIQTVLDEARKFGLHLVLINQFIDQITDIEIKKAIKSNTNIKIFGKNHFEHFKYFGRSLQIPEEEFAKIKKYHFYIKSGDKKAVMIPSSNELESGKYRLTDNQEKSLDSYLLSKYYRLISQISEIDELKPKFGR